MATATSEYSKAYTDFKRVIKDPSRTTHFMVKLPPLSTITSVDFVDGNDKLNLDAAWCVKDVSIPSKNLGQVIIYHRGKQIKIPGDFNISDISMTAYDTDSKVVRRYVDTWMDCVFHSFTGTRGDLDQVKIPIQIVVYNTHGPVLQGGNESMTFNCVGTFPISIGEDSRDWEAIDTPATLPLTFSIDDMEIIYNNTSIVGEAGGTGTTGTAGIL